MNTLAAPLAHHPRVTHWRNIGMIWAFEVRSDEPTLSRDVHQAALEREVLLRPIGSTVYFMPPYTLTEDEQALLVERTLEVLEQVA